MANDCKWTSCGKIGCWIVKSDGRTFFRRGVTESNPSGTDWVDTGGSFKQLDTGVRGEVYTVDDEGQVYTREGVTEQVQAGRKWSKFGNKLFNHITVGDKVVGGVTPTDGYYYTLDMP